MCHFDILSVMSRHVLSLSGYPESAEPYNLSPQAGSFEVTQSSSGGHGKVMTQTVPEPPIDTCLPLRMTRPIAVLGNSTWRVRFLSLQRPHFKKVLNVENVDIVASALDPQV